VRFFSSYMLHLWDFMTTEDFIALADRQYGWLGSPAITRLYSALSGDVYGGLLPGGREDQWLEFMEGYILAAERFEESSVGIFKR